MCKELASGRPADKKARTPSKEQSLVKKEDREKDSKRRGASRWKIYPVFVKFLEKSRKGRNIGSGVRRGKNQTKGGTGIN